MSRIQTFSIESMRRIAREIFREEREAEHLKHPAVLTLNTYDPHDYQHDRSQEIKFRNTSGEEIPPYAVMLVTGYETKHGLPILTVDKPDTDFAPLYLVNGPLRVGSESTAYGTGRYLLDAPGQVLADTGGGTPVEGARWGPSNDSWYLTAHYQGFSVRAATTGTTASYGLTYVWATQDPILNDTVAFYNNSGEEIPAHAVMELSDTFDAAGRQYVVKPTTTFRRRYLVNLDKAIPIGKPGYGTYLERPNNTLSSRVLCDTSPSL